MKNVNLVPFTVIKSNAFLVLIVTFRKLNSSIDFPWISPIYLSFIQTTFSFLDSKLIFRFYETNKLDEASNESRKSFPVAMKSQWLMSLLWPG